MAHLPAGWCRVLPRLLCHCQPRRLPGTRVGAHPCTTPARSVWTRSLKSRLDSRVVVVLESKYYKRRLNLTRNREREKRANCEMSAQASDMHYAAAAPTVRQVLVLFGLGRIIALVNSNKF